MRGRKHRLCAVKVPACVLARLPRGQAQRSGCLCSHRVLGLEALPCPCSSPQQCLVLRRLPRKKAASPRGPGSPCGALCVFLLVTRRHMQEGPAAPGTAVPADDTGAVEALASVICALPPLSPLVILAKGSQKLS